MKRDTFKRAEELEDTFQTLTNKHGDNLSAPLWARLIVAGTHGTVIPPNVPMIKVSQGKHIRSHSPMLCLVQQQQLQKFLHLLQHQHLQLFVL